MLLILGDYPFSPNVRISTDPDTTLNQGESSFAVSGDSIFVACNTNERGSYPALPFSRSINGGSSFDLDYNFRDDETGIVWHTDPVVAVDDSNYVHLLVQFNVYLIRHYLSYDGGITWAETTDVSDPSTGGWVDKPWMVVRGDTVYVAWQEFGGTNEGIRLARSFDRGRTWERFDVNYRTGIIALAVGMDGTLHMAHISSGLTYRKSSDRGENWVFSRYVDDVFYSGGYGDRAPINSITVFGNDTIFITWVDDRSGNWDVLGSFSFDGGNTWSAPMIINSTLSGGQCKGWATYDPYGGLHVFYYSSLSWPTDSSTLWEVLYRYSPDGGQSWGPEIAVTDTVFTSPVSFMGDYHQMVADSHYVYAIWSDGREGDLDLFFSKAPIPLLSSQESPQPLPNMGNDGMIYDASGRKLTHIPQKPGIYFVVKEGKVKKVVVR
ncbi:MAG: exo-alpha-sialidase [Thermotogae bacterium]|nr:exo-alpha-sialidase [Thermotogota bacterium]